MSGNLSAPRFSDIRLAGLLGVAAEPAARSVVACFLSDPPALQGVNEYYTHDLDVRVDLVDVPQHLTALRLAGWIHQRPVRSGLLSRLRRGELELRFPDVIGSLDEAEQAGDGRDRRRVESELRRMTRSVL